MKAKTKKTKKTHKTLRHHAKHLVVPHKGNQYRPHLIRRHGLVAILVAVLLMQTFYNFAVGGHFSVLGRSTTTSISGLLTDTNQAREKNSLAPLKLNKKLDQAAYDKAEDMFKYNYWAHVSPSGVQPWSWLNKVQYNYDKAGENLAKNYPTSEATVQAWLASPTHRANVLNKSYTDVGFAVVNGKLQDENTSLVVAYYGKPESAAVLASTKEPVKKIFVQPQHQPYSVLASLGIGAQSLSPATLGSLILISFAAFVALASYAYRSKMPKSLRRNWYRHHSLYKAVGLGTVGFILIIATGSGQI